MDIKFEKHGTVSASITINMVKADYEPNVTKALKDFAKKAQMPGFRKGHVPASLIKRMYGTSAKAEEVNKLLQDALFNYIKDNNVDMLGEPLGSDTQEPQDIETQDEFTFTFDVALAPEFEATLSADDKITYYDIEVTDEAITAQLDAYRQQAGHPEAAESYEPKDILRGTLAELDENGTPKEGGIVVETASLMPEYFKSDDQKKLFEGAKKNDVITFNPAEAYADSEAELTGLLKVEREDALNHKGNFSYQVNEISRFVPAELNEEFFNQAFGEGNVKTEEEARAKVKEAISSIQENDSDYKFLLDVRAYMEKKVGELQFADDLLKKIMKANNKDKDDAYVEENYEKSIVELKWHLIREKLAKAQDIKVDDKDVKAAAIQATRFQFAQYGMTNIPDEYLENYAQEMLKDRQRVDGLIERCIDQKLTAALKGIVTLDKKAISHDDFNKLFEEK